MRRSPFRGTDRPSASQNIPHIIGPGDLLSHSKQTTTGAYTKPDKFSSYLTDTLLASEF